MYVGHPGHCFFPGGYSTWKPALWLLPELLFKENFQDVAA